MAQFYISSQNIIFIYIYKFINTVYTSNSLNESQSGFNILRVPLLINHLNKSLTSFYFMFACKLYFTLVNYTLVEEIKTINPIIRVVKQKIIFSYCTLLSLVSSQFDVVWFVSKSTNCILEDIV